MTGSAVRPRVHWVSPLPPAETDIAHYTARILPELAEACELVLWTDAERWDRALERHAIVRRLDPDTVTSRDFAMGGRGRGADTLFVHIGNSASFHAGFLRLLRRVPAVVVLHDLAIQELCHDAIRRGSLPATFYEAEMARWHGQRGGELARAVREGRVSAFEAAQEIPGFEIVLDRAIGVLVHTPAALEAVAATDAVPVWQLELPFRPSLRAPSPARSCTGPLRLVQFGYIGHNRRLMEVLEALAPLAGEIDFRFDIMGKVWDPAAVRARLRALGLEGCVTLHGFVPEPELDRHLAEAHLVFNLRHPTMGEASGSQLRIWNAAAAAAVTDQGWYAGLPAETVFRIPLEGEAEALRALLRRLDADRTLCARVGAAGRAHLEARHTPALYARGITAIAREADAAARDALIARTARRLLARTPSADALYRAALSRHL